MSIASSSSVKYHLLQWHNDDVFCDRCNTFKRRPLFSFDQYQWAAAKSSKTQDIRDLVANQSYQSQLLPLTLYLISTSIFSVTILPYLRVKLLEKLYQQGNHSRDRFLQCFKENRESIRKSHPQMVFQLLLAYLLDLLRPVWRVLCIWSLELLQKMSIAMFTIMFKVR